MILFARVDNYIPYDDMLLETRFNYELNYEYEKKYEWLGEMPLYRYEYDFDKNEKKLFRVTYVFKKSVSGSFFPLILAFQKKHGLPDPDCNKKTVSGDRLMRWVISEMRSIILSLTCGKAATVPVSFLTSERQKNDYTLTIRNQITCNVQSQRMGGSNVEFIYR